MTKPEYERLYQQLTRLIAENDGSFVHGEASLGFAFRLANGRTLEIKGTDGDVSDFPDQFVAINAFVYGT